MRAVRNVVVHEYFGVDPRILWETVPPRPAAAGAAAGGGARYREATRGGAALAAGAARARHLA